LQTAKGARKSSFLRLKNAKNHNSDRLLAMEEEFLGMSKENVSFFEICGPVMIGPSSSHTAGVARIAFLVRKMFGSVPIKAKIRFYGSLASTGKGHGSGDAAAAGLLGISPEDERVSRGGAVLRDMPEGRRFPLEITMAPDLPPGWHPNTLILELFGPQPSAGSGGEPSRFALGGGSGDFPPELTVRASSIGGGAIRIDEINGYQVSLSGELDAMLILHHDEIGVIAMICRLLADHRINIAATASHRKGRGDEALLVVETDGPVHHRILEQIEALSPVYKVILVTSLESPAGPL
jgi:L-serine dehydratase